METTMMSDEVTVCKKQISWTAVGIGVLVCLGLSFLLNLFSLATSLSLVTTDKDGLTTLAIGGFIGMAIGVVAVMFVSGFVAGALGKPYNPAKNLGVVYGFATWSLALIITIMLAGKVGSYVAFYSNFVADPKVVIDNSDYRSQRSMVEMRGNTMNVDLASTNQNNPKVIDNNTRKVANTLGMSSLLVFVLFFLGGFASAFGGHCGMTCCCRNDRVNCDTPKMRVMD